MQARADQVHKQREQVEAIDQTRRGVLQAQDWWIASTETHSETIRQTDHPLQVQEDEPNRVSCLDEEHYLTANIRSSRHWDCHIEWVQSQRSQQRRKRKQRRGEGQWTSGKPERWRGVEHGHGDYSRHTAARSRRRQSFPVDYYKDRNIRSDSNDQACTLRIETHEGETRWKKNTGRNSDKRLQRVQDSWVVGWGNGTIATHGPSQTVERYQTRTSLS